MEIKSVASFATYSARERADQEVKIEVLRKGLESATATMKTLIDAVPPAPRLPDTLGRNINTTA